MHAVSPGSLISKLPGTASRTHVESRGSLIAKVLGTASRMHVESRGSLILSFENAFLIARVYDIKFTRRSFENAC